MKRYRYGRWDGTQEPFHLDADAVLDAVSELLLEGLDVAEALRFLESQGFELAGLDMRVLGVEELLSELRDRVRELEQGHDLASGLADLDRRFQEILDREQSALRERHGLESSRLNDFLARRHGDEQALSDRIERFRDWRFEDEAAGEAFAELLEELDRLRELECFIEERGERGAGGAQVGYERAQEIREEIEALERLARALAEGRFSEVSPEELARALGEGAGRSWILLRDLRGSLQRAGYLRAGEGEPELTPRAIRRLGAQALADVYGALRRGRPGEHTTRHAGPGEPRPDETRSWEPGEALDLHVGATLRSAVLRRARAGDAPRVPIALEIGDFEVAERDHSSQTTTVLLLDMSWSMSWAGRFPAAKRVALALDHLIRTRYPRDRFFVVGFYTRAVELRPQELPEASWNLGDPFTNLQEGLMVARRLIRRHPSPSPQILVITDGQPTAYFHGRELRVEWPMGPGGISPHAVEATLREVRRVTRQGITINTFMLDDSPQLVGFVERMTQINRGRALYSHPEKLGSYVMVDYLGRKTRQRRR